MLLRLAVGLAFIVVPMLELMLLIKIGQSIGVLATVALVLTTALTGAYIVSRQSLTVITRTLEAVSEGRPPVEPALDGLLLLVAGALLITPGLITDVLALALLVPPVRRAVARAFVRWLLRRADVGTATYDDTGPGRGPERAPPSSAGLGEGPVIEGEFERVDERPASRHGSPHGPHRNNGRPASRA
jgi:UPF0716 protein FxsA